MVSFSHLNLNDAVIDEVALEGLDGINLEALWKRMALRLHESEPLPKSLREQIWSICTHIDNFEFYKLEVAREPLVIFDRYEFVDPDLGTILEPDNPPPDIYPHHPIFDTTNGNKGSCSSYYTRREVSDARCISLDKATVVYGDKLVIVASQALRERALMGFDVCPTLELNVMQYCFLERVGRARYHGEVTQGKLSLNALKEDPKSLFYHRKFLLRHKLVTKQLHHQKSGGHGCNGSLLHLPRFYIERKPKVIFLAERVIEILKSKPHFVAEYDEIKKKLQIDRSIRKLYKTSFFQKVVRTDLRIPYRTLYPNAEPSEWQQKAYPTKERTIKVVQLLEPDIDITETWNKDEIADDEEPQELDISQHKYGIPYLTQANRIIENRKSEGACQGSIAKDMGLTKLQARTILRNLVRAKIVATYMNDVGRQRFTKYVSKRFEKGSKMSKEFKKEMNKIQELSRQITNENDSTKSKLSEMKTSEICNSEAVDVPPTNPELDTSDNNICVPDMSAEQRSTTIELNSKFRCVNHILQKYRLSKYIRSYKKLHMLVSERNVKGAKENAGKRNAAIEIKKLPTISDVSKDENAAAMYKNVKVVLTAVKPMTSGNGLNGVFGLMENVKNKHAQTSSITYRLLRRANIIIESVKKHQVIDDIMKLIKLIHEEEDKEGYDVKIDKKSLLRLLQKLTKDNLIRSIKVTLSVNDKEKNMTFICDPSVDIDHSVIKSALEQAKIKFCIMGTKSIPKQHTERIERSKVIADESCDKSKSDERTLAKQPAMEASSFQYDFKAAKRYGYIPKFVRLQALHILLYYLVYEHTEKELVSKAEQIKALRTNGFEITDDIVDECSTIYTKEVNWKMFIPPLPKHSGWPKGWFLMCDVLLRMPLSIFLKIHFVHFVVPGIENYLNHPIRKHYLVRDLPASIRSILLFQRKYIFSIHQNALRLCWLGLLQFGPQKLKEKDQVFVYLNRRTELLDTTSSDLGYHKTEQKEYPAIKYYFDETQIIEKYWYDMWNTCMNTPLGGRLVVQGKEILLEDLSKKPEMINAARARTPEEAEQRDTGFVPGDRRGAAGLDSAFFPHLKRNWNWSLVRSSPISRQLIAAPGKSTFERDTYLSQIKVKPLKFTEFPGLRTVSGPGSLNTPTPKRKTHEYTEKKTRTVETLNKYENLLLHKLPKQKAVIRKVLPPKKPKSRGNRQKYDDVDYRALQRMSKLRVDWDPHEDKILLLCKVVMMYICPNPHKQLVTFTTVRDVLRLHSFRSYNKTSRACQRRLLYMMKQPKTMNSVALGVEEIKQNFFLSKRFNGISDKIKRQSKNSAEYEKRIAGTFKVLAAYVIKKYYDFSEIGPKEPFPVPSTPQEFNIFYKLVYPTKPFSSRGFVKDIGTVNDIHSATINSVIHSSMCSGKDRRSWAYQLFKVYQQYPEMLLRNAMLKTRADQMVTVKKNTMCWPKKYSNCMPISSSQYQLSSNFIYKFHTKWPYPILSESYNVFLMLTKHYSQNNPTSDTNISSYTKTSGIEIPKITGGLVAAIHDYVIQNQMVFDIGLPNQIIMLDSEVQQSDEVYFKIAQRYQDVLASLDSLQVCEDSNVQNEVCSSVRRFEHHRKPGSVNYPEAIKHFSSDNDKLCNSEKFDVESDDNADNDHTKKHEDGDAFMDLQLEANSILSPHRKRKLDSDKTKQSLEIEEEHLDIDDDKCRNIEGEDTHVIKLQDGTKIVLNENDIENLATPEIKRQKIAGNADNLDKFVKRNNEDSGEERIESDGHFGTLPTQPSGQVIAGLPELLKDVAHRNKRVRDTTDIVNTPDEPMSKKLKTLQPTTGSTNVSESSAKGNEDSKHPFSTNAIQNEQKNINDKFDKLVEDGNGHNADNNIYIRTSQIIQNCGSRSHGYTSSLHKNSDASDVQRRGTRIALLKMREELNGLTTADSHHAHDFFVVNMFKIYYSLKSQQRTEVDTFGGIVLPKDLVPLALTKANSLLKDISKFALLPKIEISYTDYKQSLTDMTSEQLDNMDMVCSFIRFKKEIGASIRELLDVFEKSMGKDLITIIDRLTNARILLRAGVTVTRYIYHHHTDPWVINSYKINRLERESLPPIRRGTIYVPETERAGNEDVEVNRSEVPIEEKNLTSSMNEAMISKVIFGESPSLTVESNVAPANDGNDSVETNSTAMGTNEQLKAPKRRTSKRRTNIMQQDGISRATKQLDSKTSEEIRVSIRPWIRVDGILNRRVLDRMLGAILTYCLKHPGILLTKVQTRFVPALQPFHTRELVEILVKLQCLTERTLKKNKITLFSKPISVHPGTASNHCVPEEDIFLEPARGAMLKFGIFLSTKSYSADFIK